MIKGLRRKFIFINMALVGAVLLVVIIAISVTGYRQQRMEGNDAMRMALGREMGMPPERFQVGRGAPREKPVGLLPVFTAFVDETGKIIGHDAGHVDISQEDIAHAVSLAMDQAAEEGILPEMNLRYMRQRVPDGMKIAFLDRSVEQSALASQLVILSLTGLGGLLALFGISLFLSGWATRPAAQAWAQQQQFIADASHELKTPLTVILANLNILSQRPKSTVEQEMKWIDNTQAEAVRMRKLVDDLLFLAKSDMAQAPPLEKARFSLSEAMWNCLLPFESVTFEQGVTLTSEIGSDIEMTGNEPQIKQLIVILLDNACKFAGAKGSVSVRLTAGQGKAQIRVQNTGEVIPEATLTHVFERFYRADKARARAQGGYGLGLSIAAHIVDAHAGTIHAASTAREGTVFTVTLPTAG